MPTLDTNSSDDARTPLLQLPKKAPAKAKSLAHDIGLLFQDWFLWEILSALVAVVALVGIVCVLAVYDGSSLPDWPGVLTINSVISIFATIGKLAVMSAVGACISQAKWLWYRCDDGGEGEKGRPLVDLQGFDDASRGPWGAVGLLGKVGVRSQASLSAAIVVLMLLFDPFLQQAVVYPDRLVLAEELPTIVRAQNYEAHSYEGLPLPSVMDLSMKAAIYSGIFDVSNKANVGTEHRCPTGNCTWEEFSSLAICSKCADITSYIDKSCNDTGCYELSLPDGPQISGSGGQINSSVTRISSALEGIEPSVLQFSSLISKSQNSSEDASAWECVLSYCVNVYSVAVHDGNLEQEVSGSWLNNSASYSQESDLIYRPPHSIINTTANGSEFLVSRLAASAMNSFMSEMFTGSGGINGASSGSAFSSDVIQALYDVDDHSSRIANLATSMSNNIRQQNDKEAGPFEGQALKSETYVQVRWAWLSYPIILVLMSLISLTGTIVENSRGDVRVWGASNLALLFHGQGLPLNDVGKVPIDKISQMSEKAKSMQVLLVKGDDEEWKLVKTG